MSDESAEGARAPDADDLARRLEHRFSDGDILIQALTHRSWCAEHDGSESNERLEFLGDAVLGLIVTDHVFDSYPDLPEGALAKVRASVVSSAALAEMASELGLGEHLRLGRGEEITGGRSKPSILADAMEAVIGALYLDGGWDTTANAVLDLLGPRIAAAASGPGGSDYKTRLQEVAARRFESLPSYEIVDEGPDHAKRFFATVVVDGEALGSGEGRSKKQAQQAAARSAWVGLERAGALGDEAGGDGAVTSPNDDNHTAGAAHPGAGNEAVPATTRQDAEKTTDG
ncbi:MAG: ribonuclease III [Actinomycetota bacterium]|nr:ribonuclease III [Actinomycetota bacterium]